MKPFHRYHITKIFSLFDQENRGPFDLFLREYMLHHHQLGSKDRKLIKEVCSTLLRWSRLLEKGGAPLSWEEKLDVYLTTDLESLKNDPHLPLSVRCSMPEWIFKKFSNAYGEAAAFEMSLSLSKGAPLTIRANRIKTTREALYELLSPEYRIEKCHFSLDGIQFQESAQLLTSPLYKKGLFEIQDEASQWASSLIQAKPGETVLDMCAGSGGKTLALAPDMRGKGTIYLHDIRPQILLQAKERLKRAGVQGAVFSLPPHPVDIVVVDAPCSGSGTWKRSFDQKWNLCEEKLHSLIETQRQILTEAVSFVKPGGRLVYITCSLFTEENEKQIDWFLEHFPFSLQAPPFQSINHLNIMDGLFTASLKKNFLLSSS